MRVAKAVCDIFVRDGVELPEYKTLMSSGMDIRAYLPEEGSVTIWPNSKVLIPTGIHVALPEGFEFQVRSRSGLANKDMVIVLNSPGTIDEDYRGDIGVILINKNQEKPFHVQHGDRIAQLVLQHVPKVEWNVVDTLDDLGKTERGAGGFGHTGVK